MTLSNVRPFAGWAMANNPIMPPTVCGVSPRILEANDFTLGWQAYLSRGLRRRAWLLRARRDAARTVTLA
jgi:hypothetical protein